MTDIIEDERFVREELVKDAGLRRTVAAICYAAESEIDIARERLPLPDNDAKTRFKAALIRWIKTA